MADGLPKASSVKLGIGIHFPIEGSFGIFVKKTTFMDYLILVGIRVLFYFFHSVFADIKIKRKFKGWWGTSFIWYRLLYCFFATVHLLGIMLFAATIRESPLLAKTPWLSYLGYLLATFGTIVLVRSFKYLPLSEFVGLRPVDEFSDKDKLVETGLHAYVRHPIYSGLILVFSGYFFFQPTFSSLLHWVLLLVYLPIGIFLEEKKLTAKFGLTYLDYKKSTPALIPWKK